MFNDIYVLRLQQVLNIALYVKVKVSYIPLLCLLDKISSTNHNYIQNCVDEDIQPLYGCMYVKFMLSIKVLTCSAVFSDCIWHRIIMYIFVSVISCTQGTHLRYQV